MNIRLIVVPVDFSTCSLLVTRQASGLAARLGAKVLVLHVAELPSGMSAGSRVQDHGQERPVEEVLRADADARLQPYAAEARAQGAEVEVQVALGPIVPPILTVTEAVQADLMVIGTHGRTGLARAVLGSVAEEVARRAHVPVMLVRRETRPECARQSCEWCPHDDRSPVEAQVAAESEG
jgi:nucleotide-binding universal stress UspA family protein